MRLAETGQTIGPSSGPVGADGSTAVLGVLVEGGGSTAAPHKLIGAGGSAAMPGVPVEGDGSTAMPHELMGAGGFVATLEVPTERGGSTAVPSEIREVRPSAQEQGAGSKRSRLDELEQESGGSSPKRSYHPTAPA